VENNLNQQQQQEYDGTVDFVGDDDHMRHDSTFDSHWPKKENLRKFEIVFDDAGSMAVADDDDDDDRLDIFSRARAYKVGSSDGIPRGAMLFGSGAASQAPDNSGKSSSGGGGGGGDDDDGDDDAKKQKEIDTLAAATAAATAAAASSKRQHRAADAQSNVTRESADASQMQTAIFPTIWNKLEADYGREQLRFPKEIVWLMGAPGSGKGTHCEFLKQARGFTADPLSMSDLLSTPEAERVKSEGRLLDDSTVLELLLRQLLRPEYQSGVVVDGFPRTPAQVEAIKLLRDRMYSLRRQFFDDPRLGMMFRRPRFRVVVLFVDESQSVMRQLSRGEKTRQHNEQVRATGNGDLLEERATDHDEPLARERYKIFKEHYITLESLRKHFTFTFVDAGGSVDAVQRHIITELEYQSSQELASETFDAVLPVPVVRDLQQHARQFLIQRLDNYQSRHTLLFGNVIVFIERELVPVLRKHVFSGHTIFRSTSSLLLNRHAIDMLIDVLTERGYYVHSTFFDSHIPDSVDRETLQISCRLLRTFEFHISFPALRLRGRNLEHTIVPN
jgi:adenylate kinase